MGEVGIPIGGLHCEQNICLEYALESRGLCVGGKWNLLSPEVLLAPGPKERVLKEKSLFLFRPFS